MLSFGAFAVVHELVRDACDEVHGGLLLCRMHS